MRDACLHIAIILSGEIARVLPARAREIRAATAPAPHSTHFITMGKNAKARLVRFFSFQIF